MIIVIYVIIIYIKQLKKYLIFVFNYDGFFF